MEPELHMTRISEASSQEETLAATDAPQSESISASESLSAPKPKKEIKPFAYDFDGNKLSVPGFKWKAGEGAEKLQAYCDVIKSMIEKIEDHLTQP